MIISISILLFLLAIILCFFPSVELPKIMKVLGIFSLLICWAFLGSITVGLSDSVGAGYSSATTILKKVLRINNESKWK